MNNGSQDMPMGNMPPMDMQPDMGMGNDMGGDFMPQGQDMMGGADQGMGMPQMDDGQSEFDTNFDAGVEADEEQDPKKYIQQLTGKLSQTLQKYNNDNGQPDVDLNKYVAGMITKQAMKGLSEQDAEDIIDKVKADEDFEMTDQQMPQDGQMGGDQGMEMQQGQDMMPQGGGDMQQQMNESLKRRMISRQIDEICRSIFNDKEEKPLPKKNYKETSYSYEPYATI